MSWSDGTEYEGLWKNDRRFKGKLTFIDEIYYNGCFKDNHFDGRGQYVVKDYDCKEKGAVKILDGVFKGGEFP